MNVITAHFNNQIKQLVMNYSNKYLHEDNHITKEKYQKLSSYSEQLQICYSQKIQIMTCELQQSQQKITCLEEVIQELKQDVNQKDQEVKQHQVQIEKLLKIIEQLEVIAQQKASQNNDLIKENNAIKQQAQSLQLKLYASEFELQSLKEQIKQQRNSEENDTTLSEENSECKILKDISNQQKLSKVV